MIRYKVALGCSCLLSALQSERIQSWEAKTHSCGPVTVKGLWCDWAILAHWRLGPHEHDSVPHLLEQRPL